jgi:K+-sensing histidine kinase KdpD
VNKRRNPSFWLYAIGSYILLQFLWWAWLLIDQSSEIVQLSNEPDPETALNRKILMVLGEGIVFIVLLLFGFKKLRNSIEREVEIAHTQRNFLLSVTHELNTPLATIKLLMETMVKRELDEDKRTEVSQKVLSETERLKRLVDNILTSTRIEEDQIVLHPEKHDLSKLVRESAKPFVERTKSERINLDLRPNSFARVDPLAVQSIVQNLLENADKYSSEDSSIKLSVKPTETEVILSVTDFGIGIKTGDRAAIFNKFYRVQSEETRTTKGTGLGLFIVKNLVESQSGKIEYKPNSPKGSIFEVTFPKAS